MSGRGDVGALWNGNGEAQLLALAQPRGDKLFLSRTIGTAPLEDSGCNGAAGQVLLFLAAHRVYRDPVFLAASQGFGKFAGRGEGDLGSLCCGHAGGGFAMLSLFRATGFAPGRAGFQTRIRTASSRVSSARRCSPSSSNTQTIRRFRCSNNNVTERSSVSRWCATPLLPSKKAKSASRSAQSSKPNRRAAEASGRASPAPVRLAHRSEAREGRPVPERRAGPARGDPDGVKGSRRTQSVRSQATTSARSASGQSVPYVCPSTGPGPSGLPR